MENLVVKTAVKTAIIVVCMVVICIGILNFAFPQHLATFAERVGNYSLAVKYASLRYSYTGDEYDLSRCVDDSILCGRNDYIISYGEKLISHDKFEDVCEYKNTLFQSIDTIQIDYKQYIGGKVAVAKYESDDFDGALSLVDDINGQTSFKSGNAVMALSIKVLTKKDSSSAKKIIDLLNNFSVDDEEQLALYNKLVESLNKIVE